MKSFLLILVLAILSTTCLDRINFDVGRTATFPITVDGYISDEPGPYKVEITKAFDIQSTYSLRTPISVKRLTISDNQGASEVLSEVSHGVYQTNPQGIRGTVGHVYTLKIDLLDGREYKSSPDTLLPPGKVDSIYFEYREVPTDTTSFYGFDVFFNASTGIKNNYQFLWKFTGTYKVDTNPELYDTLCVEARCPKPLACSGYVADSVGNLRKKTPCQCCTCWIDFFNTAPIVSDNSFVVAGQLQKVFANFVPINQWTFMYQVHTEVKQLSLSRQAFDFWKAVKKQGEAVTSLFQPLTGKFPSNFVQTNGPATPIEGLFFATSVSRHTRYITRYDMPNQIVIPPQNLPYKNTCKLLFPYSNTQKPSYWID